MKLREILTEKIKYLPDESLQEIIDFIDFLIWKTNIQRPAIRQLLSRLREIQTSETCEIETPCTTEQI